MAQELDFEPIDLSDNGAIYGWLQEQKAKQAVLVYASSDLKQYLADSGLAFVDLDQGIDHSMLRSLDELVQDQVKAPQIALVPQFECSSGFRTLIATDIAAMRGIDYRAPTKGICLLVCKSFSNKRESNQAGYRVGRQADKCARLILKGLDLLDDAAVLSYKTMLCRFIRTTTPRPVIKQVPATRAKLNERWPKKTVGTTKPVLNT
jgi:hypothetical protein